MVDDQSNPHPAPRRRRRIIARAALALGIVAGGLGLNAPPAPAATVATLTVTTLDYVGDDVAPGNGVCATAGGQCTLKAAIQEANALNAGPGDTVLINFSGPLAGFIVGPNGNNLTNRMKTGIIANGWDHSGAYFHITGRTTIDFGGDVGFTQFGDEGTGFFIDGPDVTIRNFKATGTHPNGTRVLRGITAGETAFVVSGNGDRFTLEDGSISESSSNWLERGVILLNGADGFTMRNVELDAFEDLGGAIRILQNAQIDGFTLDGVDMHNTAPESSYYGVYTEPGVKITNLKILNSTFRNWKGSRVVYFNGSNITGGLVQGNTFTDYAYGGIRFALDFGSTTLTDVTFQGNTLEAMDADQVLTFVSGNLTRVAVTNNTFKDITQTSYNTIDARSATTTDLSITGNTFQNIRSDGGWSPIRIHNTNQTRTTIADNTFTDVAGSGSIVDSRDSNVSRLTITGNTFTRVSTGFSFLDVRGGTGDRITFSDNQISDSSATFPVVWANGIRPNSLVERNTTVNPTNAKKVGWFFVYDNGGTPAATDTGWRVRDNHVDVATNESHAPIRIDSGFLPVERNTFGPLTRGTTVAEDASASSETGASWFVWNVNANANGKLRTWYPNAALVDPATGRARITVQPPTPSETPSSGSPVSIDVYYTPGSGGQRQADQYLGRLVGVTTQSTHELACVGCDGDGYLRVQTIAANGATTQYSRIVTPTVGTITVPAITIDVAPGTNVPVGSPVTGSGTPGATVEVVNTTTSEELCSTTVTGGGTWSCEVDEGATQGPATIVATEEVDDVVTSTAPVEVTVTPAVVGVSMFGPGAIALLLGGGLVVAVRRRRRTAAAA